MSSATDASREPLRERSLPSAPAHGAGLGRAIGLGILVGVLGLLVLDAALARSGLASSMLPRAAGDGPWLLSRAAGLVAYVALSLSVLSGLSISMGALDRWVARARIAELHPWLSSVTLALLAAHVLALLGDGFARLDVLDLTIPFLSSVQRLPTALGVLSAYLLLALPLSHALRGRIGARAWRRWHFTSFGLYGMATLHGIAAGTDSRRPLITGIYLVSSAFVAGAVALRILDAREKAQLRAARAARSSTSSSAHPLLTARTSP